MSLYNEQYNKSRTGEPLSDFVSNVKKQEITFIENKHPIPTEINVGNILDKSRSKRNGNIIE